MDTEGTSVRIIRVSVLKGLSEKSSRTHELLETFRFENDSTRTRFHLTFFLVFSKNRHPGKLRFSLEKIALLSILKEVKPSLVRKMIKLPAFDNSFPSLRHSC